MVGNLKKGRLVTLFTLGNSEKFGKRGFFTYLGVTIFCVVFGLVYESFSHGVTSNFMLFSFLVPLILGVIPFAIFFFAKIKTIPSKFSYYFYNFSIATLTVGSIFKGVLDIYGTTRDFYIYTFLIAGISFLAIGIISHIVILIISRTHAQND